LFQRIEKTFVILFGCPARSTFAQRMGAWPATKGPLNRASALGAKCVLWRQADTNRISRDHFIFVTPLAGRV
jgi:hypothetical protein